MPFSTASWSVLSLSLLGVEMGGCWEQSSPRMRLQLQASRPYVQSEWGHSPSAKNTGWSARQEARNGPGRVLGLIPGVQAKVQTTADQWCPTVPLRNALASWVPRGRISSQIPNHASRSFGIKRWDYFLFIYLKSLWNKLGVKWVEG